MINQQNVSLSSGYAVVLIENPEEAQYQTSFTQFGQPRSAWLRKTEQEAWDWIGDRTDKFTVEYITVKCECYRLKRIE